MSERMPRWIAAGVCAALCVLLSAGVLLADIVQPVDYWYEGTWSTNTQGNTVWTWTNRGPNDWGPPWWQDATHLYVTNRPRDLTKHLYIEIEYAKEPEQWQIPAVVGVTDPNGDPAGWKDLGGVPGKLSWTYHWTRYPQPENELIAFIGNVRDRPGDYGITKIEVATRCVPLPAAALLAAPVMAGVLIFRRRRPTTA